MRNPRMRTPCRKTTVNLAEFLTGPVELGRDFRECRVLGRDHFRTP
jgi:hypothetical protein